MSSNDPVVNSMTKSVEPTKPVKNKNIMGAARDIEINHDFLDESLHKNNH